MKRIAIAAVALVVALAVAAPLAAQKKKDDEEAAAAAGPKKTIAIGHVDMGQMGFNSMAPGQVGDLMRNRIKKELEATGNFNVITPPVKTAEQWEQIDAKEQAELEKTPQPKTPAEAMRYARKMQAQMEKTMQRTRGGYVHEPVGADALFNFSVRKSQKRVSSGGIFDTAADLGAPHRVGHADFSTETMKLDLLCVQLDPRAGNVLDQHDAQASSTRYANVGGASYYTMEDTSDPDRAYDRMFKRAVKDCVKWIDQKMTASAEK